VVGVVEADGDEVAHLAVIGKRASYVHANEALDYVAGYCVCHDVSEREFQLGVVRADDAGRRLVEQDRLGGDRRAGLGGVVGVVDEALDYVAGYCVCHDVSEREFQLERGGTWTKGKGSQSVLAEPLGRITVSFGPTMQDGALLNRIGSAKTVCHDVSEREFQLERGGTWTKGKGCPTFGPLGPWGSSSMKCDR
jgi:2-keto-4-pentenoate hydratase/2-oxohepta-3-ene-1,7-dioic acid hydratase in catechol pathway